MARKRGREDDSDSDWDKERYMKKSRPRFHDHTNQSHVEYQPLSNLPHCPSQTPSPPRLFTDIRSMTPAQSDYGATSPDSIHSSPVGISRESSKLDYDMDMDDDEMDVRSQPPESPAFGSMGTFMRPAMLQPSLFNADAASSNGRIPTPIHATFKRAGINGIGYTMSGSAGSTDQHQSSIQVPLPGWKRARKEPEEERSRRMPSPISEDDDIPDTPTALTQSQLSRLSFSHASSTDHMDTTESSTKLSLPPTPRGRKRSGAMTGMPRFSMGYRDDCDKCRQRVPGHYSHFLP
ncbi:hypothetical protein BDW02DRAFT_492215 [Decorospora gaudefroyi]|uniref:Uncharacterized protein n=1 Tax=Decorospora gaudefroyi TaxID=184978 RepID=A0A6A5KPP2_9PLEO|nr:hypothetical protein BDW02DRAFT_492215 [Decorospora gaudefroyi]